MSYDTGLPDEDPSSADDEEDDDDNTAPCKPKREQWWKLYTRRDGSPTTAVTITEETMSTWWKPDDSEKGSFTPEPEWMITSVDQFAPDNNWANVVADNFVPPPANSLLAQTGDMGAFIQWYCKKRGLPKLTKKDLEGPTYEIVKAFHPDVVHLQYQIEECHKMMTDQVNEDIIDYSLGKPLPLGRSSGRITIQADFFFNKDLEYLRTGTKNALSITKMKVARYTNVGLEQMVPDQMWSDEDCKYDIAASFGISHWWFKKREFYIARHTAAGDPKAAYSKKRILSVIRVELFPTCGYNYMKNIVL